MTALRDVSLLSGFSDLIGSLRPRADARGYSLAAAFAAGSSAIACRFESRGWGLVYWPLLLRGFLQPRGVGLAAEDDRTKGVAVVAAVEFDLAGGNELDRFAHLKCRVSGQRRIVGDLEAKRSQSRSLGRRDDPRV